MAKAQMKVHQPEVSGNGAGVAEMTLEQTAERKEFLELKLEDLQARQDAVKAELETLK
jgi:hypothetical protein